nr:MAG TPA: hypothetical protein [Caudoviricetes sp.]
MNYHIKEGVTVGQLYYSSPLSIDEAFDIVYNNVVCSIYLTNEIGVSLSYISGDVSVSFSITKETFSKLFERIEDKEWE